MLKANMGLRKLDLSNTRLGAEACLLLAEGLKVRGGRGWGVFGRVSGRVTIILG
jgi:hypothetical protein